jgi:hypothetical protein
MRNNHPQQLITPYNDTVSHEAPHQPEHLTAILNRASMAYRRWAGRMHVPFQSVTTPGLRRYSDRSETYSLDLSQTPRLYQRRQLVGLWRPPPTERARTWRSISHAPGCPDQGVSRDADSTQNARTTVIKTADFSAPAAHNRLMVATI